MKRLMFKVLFALITASVVKAEPAAYVGGLLGLRVPDYEDTSARLGFGITAGAKLGPEWAIAGYYLSSTKEEDSDGMKFDFEYQLYGIEGSYHFEGEAKGVYLGLRLGTSKIESEVSINGQKVSLDTSPMHWGLVAGYNHWIMENFSLGGEVSYIAVASGKDKGYEIDAFNTINLMGSAKFWF